MNQALKDRLENFDDLFPCLKERCDRERVRNRISVFRSYHDHLRVNGGGREGSHGIRREA
jgi:hypothetical protein